MEKMQSMKEEMDEDVFFPDSSGNFPFQVILKKYFPYLYFELACTQLCFRQGKGISRRNESTNIIR